MPSPTCTAEEAPLTGAGRFTTRTQIVLATCACAGATAFLYAVDPVRHAVYPQCFLYNSTGIYCAGCGATRAVHALLHGRVLDALHDNVLFVTALPLLLYMIGSHTLEAWQRNAWPAIPGDGRTWGKRGLGIFFVLIAFMALRNLPGWPFDWLKPLANG
jgi:hypothetical protein